MCEQINLPVTYFRRTNAFLSTCIDHTARKRIAYQTCSSKRGGFASRPAAVDANAGGITSRFQFDAVRRNAVARQSNGRRMGVEHFCIKIWICHQRASLQDFKRHCSCTARSSFFSERVIDIWNSLPSNAVDFTSLASFKRSVSSFDSLPCRPIVCVCQLVVLCLCILFLYHIFKIYFHLFQGSC